MRARWVRGGRDKVSRGRSSSRGHVRVLARRDDVRAGRRSAGGRARGGQGLGGGQSGLSESRC